MSQKERDQLHAEFSILASLKHSNIVGYYHREHLKQTQELYLYMEYCGGGDLGTIIKDLKKKREYPKEEFVWRILSQLVTALYRCHYGVDPPEPGNDFARQKDTRPKGKDMILHRDLKPENIFLGEDQSVKLGDFGLSKLMQSHDFASTYVGTPFYMSPEICASEKYTLHSDIWSVGCIMYELCTHSPPFNANSHLQLIQRIRKGEYAPIPAVYSRDLSNVITQCLKTNPHNRPDTASLLTVPYIWLARRQQEMVGLGRALKSREEIAEHKLRQAEERLSAMASDKIAMRSEIEAQIRREWEVKARLEIDRQVNAELERLRNQFEDEVKIRVSEALAKVEKIADATTSRDVSSRAISSKSYSSSVNTLGEEDFPSATDVTDLSQLSLKSPASSTIQAVPPKKTKTPFSRSKTTFDSPADVQMSEPSPMSINGLGLSPRRTAVAQVTASTTTTSFGAKNIFAEAARQKARWEPTLAYSSEDEENIDPDEFTDDDDDIPELPSPTRAKPSVASTDPFKQPLPPQLRTRPGLTRQHTAATMQHLTTKPSLFPTSNIASAKAEAVKASIAAAQAKNQGGFNIPPPRGTTDPSTRPPSPNRRMSKIPTQPLDGVFVGSTSPIRRTNTTGKLQSKLASAKQITNTSGNAIGGRTLVELAQARAGGRPVSSCDDFSSEKDLPAVPIWDAEAEGDNMPSPFLKREVKLIRVLMR